MKIGLLKKGFSLLEMTIVVAISAIIAVGVAQAKLESQRSESRAAFAQQLRTIADATQAYVVAYHSLIVDLHRVAPPVVSGSTSSTSLNTLLATPPLPTPMSAINAQLLSNLNAAGITTFENLMMPTIQNLVSLGYLPGGSSNLSLLNASAQLRVFIRPEGTPACINALVPPASSTLIAAPESCDYVSYTYANAPIQTAAGAPDLVVIGEIMQKANVGIQVGYSNTPNTLITKLGAGMGNNPDPTLRLGIVAARASFDASPWASYLRRDGYLPMTGNLQMAGNEINRITRLTGDGAAIAVGNDFDMTNNSINGINTLRGNGTGSSITVGSNFNMNNNSINKINTLTGNGVGTSITVGNHFDMANNNIKGISQLTGYGPSPINVASDVMMSNNTITANHFQGGTFSGETFTGERFQGGTFYGKFSGEADFNSGTIGGTTTINIPGQTIKIGGVDATGDIKTKGNIEATGDIKGANLIGKCKMDISRKDVAAVGGSGVVRDVSGCEDPN